MTIPTTTIPPVTWMIKCSPFISIMTLMTAMISTWMIFILLVSNPLSGDEHHWIRAAKKAIRHSLQSNDTLKHPSRFAISNNNVVLPVYTEMCACILSNALTRIHIIYRPSTSHYLVKLYSTTSQCVWYRYPLE